MEGKQLILFMFLIVILCILCIMLGYFYAKTKIRYFYNKMREEEIKSMQQQRQRPNVRVIKASQDEEELFKDLMQHILSKEDFEKMMKKMTFKEFQDIDKKIYFQALEMSKKMMARGFYIRDFDVSELKTNGFVLENYWYYLIVYFEPEMKIKCYPNIDCDGEWQDYYDSFEDVRIRVNTIHKGWHELYKWLKQKFPEFKIIQFGGLEYKGEE